MDKVPSAKLKNIGLELMEEIYADENDDDENNIDNFDYFMGAAQSEKRRGRPSTSDRGAGGGVGISKDIFKVNPTNFDGQESVIGKKTDTDFDSEHPQSFLDSFENEFITAT